MLHIKNISYKYPNNSEFTFQDFSLEINPGEIVQLKGTNGSGKTTILNCVSGFLKPNSGDIILDGIVLNKIPVYRRAGKYKLGRIFSDRLVFEDMTVIENLQLVHQKKFWGSKDIESNEILNNGILKGKGKQIAMKLSGGEKRMLSLLMIPKNCKYLLLDEPFNGLHSDNVNLIVDKILKLKKENIGILLIDHSNNMTPDRTIQL